MSMADGLVALVEDHYFLVAGVHLTGDANVYLGLSRTIVNADGSNLDEPSASDGYARIPVGLASGVTWSVDLAAYARNDQEIKSAKATASWGTIVDAFITTDPTVGGAVDRLIDGFLDPFSVTVGGRAFFPANNLRWGTYAAGSPVKRYSTAFTDAQILNSVLNGIAAPNVLTWVGLHSYPFFNRPQHDGAFGEMWDYVVGSLTNYTRRFIWKADTAFANRWQSPKLGEIQNFGIFNFHPAGGGTGTGWPGAWSTYFVNDSQGVDPGYVSGTPLPAGSGGGNLLFWIEGPTKILGGGGDIVRFQAGEFDLTLD